MKISIYLFVFFAVILIALFSFLPLDIKSVTLLYKGY